MHTRTEHRAIVLCRPTDLGRRRKEEPDTHASIESSERVTNGEGSLVGVAGVD